VRSLEWYIHATASQLYQKKKKSGQELALMGKKGVCERSQWRFLALSSFDAWNGFENTVAAFSLFHMSELLFIDMSVFVFTSVVPLTGCWSYGQGDIGQGMHIGQNGSRESGQVPAAFVFIPNDILRDE
jgi:hypothetical protein